MFNLFKKKEPGIKLIDKVVIDESAKLNSLLLQWNNNKDTAFIFWFDESLRLAESFFAGKTTMPVILLTTKEATSPKLAGQTPVFAEHYPLRQKEQELYSRMGLKTVQVFSSLKEPLFQRFGGEKIIEVMKRLGVKDDEIIEHNMISKAIQRAQGKIEKQVLIEQSAHSQDDWLKKNLPS